MSKVPLHEQADPKLAPIRGACDPAFEAVREAFAANFSEREELGAACTIYVDGAKVVDLWGGVRDAETRRSWERDTLVNFYSTGKPLAGLCALQCVERGELQLDAPLARWWPELAAAGKQDVSLRQVLSHSAGLPAIRTRLSADAVFDAKRMTRTLAAEAPWWPPGTRHVYHTNTQGLLLGEAVRRVCGESLGTVLRRRIAEPLGADLAIGLPERDLPRVADLLWEKPGPDFDPTTLLDAPMPEDERMLWWSWMNPPSISGFGVYNTRAWRTAEHPSTNGHGTARGVARVYAALAADGTLDGVQVIGPELLREATTPHYVGACPVLKRRVSFGLGFQISLPEWPFGPGSRSFGHMGTGCSLGFADPDARVGFGYVMNRVIPRTRSARCDALVDALYECLG